MRFPARFLARVLVGLSLLLTACWPVRSAPGNGMAWLPVVDIAGGGGHKGPWQQNESAYDYVDDGTVAFTPGGLLAVAWVDQRAKDVRFRLLGPDGSPQGPVRDVSRSPATFSWHPRLATSGPDRLYVLWQEIIFSGGSHGGDILFARSLDGGKRFSRPLNLSASIGGDGKGRLDRDTWSNGSLDLVTSPNGDIYAAWTEYDGALWLVRSRDDGQSFSRPRQVAGDTQRPARGPALAVDRQGRLYLAWAVGEESDADIHVAVSGDGGASFGDPVRIGSPGARADAPRLALDGAGRLHLVFADYPQSRGAPAIRHVRADSGTLRFGPPRTLSEAGQPGSYPHLATDGQGKVHVAWEAVDAGDRPHGLVHAPVPENGEIRPAPVPHSADPAGGRNGSQQGLLGKKLAAGPDGLIVLVNSSLAPGKGSRVWLMPGTARVAREAGQAVSGGEGTRQAR
ncbi:sialidase family protein [Massilia consociata]|uniref:Sialidase family protein n=1 Tax=Massilia consociata TaxID=760117 RepID=A0ABV6FJZ0_9BURK